MSPGRIVIAPDSFKGTLSSPEVVEALSLGIERVTGAEPIGVPLSDGGEGFVEVLRRGLGGSIRSHRVAGPLGNVVESSFLWLEETATAVVEMAAASGLAHADPTRLDPASTTTFGTGQLIGEALDLDASSMIVGCGGSATNDAGAGMAAALGARMLDGGGRELEPGGAPLRRIESIDFSDMHPLLGDAEVVAAVDVFAPLLGPSGASLVYGPQKGATAETARELDEALSRFADVVESTLQGSWRDVPGAGAAGGLGYGLMAFCGAEVRSGIDICLDAHRVDDALDGAALVVTGEGRIDDQTVTGKAVAGVAKRAGRHGVRIVAVCGSLADQTGSLREQLRGLGVIDVLECGGDASTTRRRLTDAGERIARTYL